MYVLQCGTILCDDMQHMLYSSYNIGMVQLRIARFLFLLQYLLDNNLLL